jgi:hypothetical protein
MATTTWNGTLLDRDCFDRHKSEKACAATTRTDRFMLYNKGKQIRFDRSSNDRTRLAMQARASRSNPFRTRRTPVWVRATGSFRSSGRFRTDTIAVN